VFLFCQPFLAWYPDVGIRGQNTWWLSHVRYCLTRKFYATIAKANTLAYFGSGVRWRKNVCSIDPDFESARNNNNPNSINEFQTLVAKKKERNLKM
jgi:hypothetical protein